MYHFVCWRSPLLLKFFLSWNFFDFCDWFQKKWILFKIQERKPLASKSLGCFPIELCPKHIQWCFQSHNKQLVKHERGYQLSQLNGTSEVVLEFLLLNWRKNTSSEGTVLNFHVTRHRVTPDIWPTQLKILIKNCHYLIDVTSSRVK